MIEIYTDGAARGNPGKGGYGVILRLGQHYKEISEGFRLTTNNRMELLACIIGLEAIKKDGQNITIFSDSKYVVDSVEKSWLFSWLKKPDFAKKKNKDLWLRFYASYKKHQIKFTWIKGHNEHKENERCDFLATTAADSNNLLVDIGYESEINSKQNLF
ncbi:MAG: ribonuclease HI [Sphingobacteriales bacterium]|jgi:ribonuclease HI|nr:MAG: ribonuclease HI [Sphingobacteriales bacterium]